jgi:D-psicose/D-tagatose/L-ribulose 3-epimerase
MAKFGIHHLVYTSTWNEAMGRAAISSARRLGYDLFEVLMFDPDDFDPAMTRRLLAEEGLEPRLGMALGPHNDIASPDPAIAARGKAGVVTGLRHAADLGAPAVSGIVYAAFNAYKAPPTADQRDRVVEALADLSRTAAALGVRLGIEPVNRYESYLVNTIDEAGDMIRASGGEHLFIHLDTFHMHMEEADMSAAIRRNAGLIGYVHLAESHRGMLGTGHFDTAGLMEALAQAGYGGDFTVEMFTPAVLGPEMAAGIRIWQDRWHSSHESAGVALDYLRQAHRGAYGPA